MSSDSIHDAVLCAEKRGRTPARSIDAALLARPYTRNCDYVMIKSSFLFQGIIADLIGTVKTKGGREKLRAS